MDLFKEARRLPVVSVGLTTAAIVGGIGGTFMAIREVFGLALPPRYLLMHITYGVCLLYVSLLAAHYRSTRFQTGALGKSFEYDKDGVLWHGSEKAIAFRVTTFLHFLENISEGLQGPATQRVLVRAGRFAGTDFAQQFGSQIYPSELRKGGSPFDRLSRADRLALWSEYDSSTGWGLLSAHEKPGRIEVLVKHPTLFHARGGDLFAHYLAGYCETFVNVNVADFGTSYGFADDLAIHGRTASFSLTIQPVAPVVSRNYAAEVTRDPS